MQNDVVLTKPTLSPPKRRSNAATIFRRFMKRTPSIIGLVVLVFLLTVALLAPVLAPYDYTATDPYNAEAAPSAEHLLGTDHLGRDVLSRLLYGTRYSLGLSFTATLIMIVVSMVLGSLAGYFGGLTSTLILRFCDILQSIPGILLNIVISQALGRGVPADGVCAECGRYVG